MLALLLEMAGRLKGEEGGAGISFWGIRFTLLRLSDDPGILKMASAPHGLGENAPKNLQMIGPKPSPIWERLLRKPR